MKENLPMSMRITRVTSNVEDDFVQVEVTDENSASRFVTLKLSMRDFANMITGLTAHGIGEVRGLEHVGLHMEHKEFTFDMPEGAKFRDKEVAQEEVLKVCPEGWTPDMGFNSQNSFFKQGEHTYYARTLIRRWVEKKEDEDDQS